MNGVTVLWGILAGGAYWRWRSRCCESCATPCDPTPANAPGEIPTPEERDVDVDGQR